MQISSGSLVEALQSKPAGCMCIVCLTPRYYHDSRVPLGEQFHKKKMNRDIESTSYVSSGEPTLLMIG